MSLPFPRPLPVLSRALSLAALPAAAGGAEAPRTLAALSPVVDGTLRALRDLEDAARGVPGALAAELFTLAGDAAAEIETVGYDLFLAVGEDAR